MSLDTTIHPLNIGLALNEADERVGQIIVTTSVALPIQDPNTGGPLQVPTDTYRVPFDKSTAKQLGEALLEIADKLKEDSGIQIANSLDGVDQAVAANNALKG